jgi:hypothetical protein
MRWLIQERASTKALRSPVSLSFAAFVCGNRLNAAGLSILSARRTETLKPSAFHRHSLFTVAASPSRNKNVALLVHAHVGPVEW